MKLKQKLNKIEYDKPKDVCRPTKRQNWTEIVVRLHCTYCTKRTNWQFCLYYFYSVYFVHFVRALKLETLFQLYRTRSDALPANPPRRKNVFAKKSKVKCPETWGKLSLLYVVNHETLAQFFDDLVYDFLERF